MQGSRPADQLTKHIQRLTIFERQLFVKHAPLLNAIDSHGSSNSKNCVTCFINWSVVFHNLKNASASPLLYKIVYRLKVTAVLE